MGPAFVSWVYTRSSFLPSIPIVSPNPLVPQLGPLEGDRRQGDWIISSKATQLLVVGSLVLFFHEFPIGLPLVGNLCLWKELSSLRSPSFPCCWWSNDSSFELATTFHLYSLWDASPVALDFPSFLKALSRGVAFQQARQMPILPLPTPSL